MVKTVDLFPAYVRFPNFWACTNSATASKNPGVPAGSIHSLYIPSGHLNRDNLDGVAGCDL